MEIYRNDRRNGNEGEAGVEVFIFQGSSGLRGWRLLQGAGAGDVSRQNQRCRRNMPVLNFGHQHCVGVLRLCWTEWGSRQANQTVHPPRARGFTPGKPHVGCD